MRDRSAIYAEMLKHGLWAIRGASERGALERIRKEADLLHNLPSLFWEKDEARHRYHLYAEKVNYLEWVLGTKDPLLMAFANDHYVPLWYELEAIARCNEKSHEGNQG